MPDANLEQLREAVRHRYNVEDLIGRGGMGAVYRARHVSLDAPVAIKVLPIPASVGADELARFRREAMLAARLPHPHIVPVYEFEIRGDLAYLVMPLVDGLSLAQRIEREGPLSMREVQELIAEIGGALAFAHERGIIHRDVKPANILWEPANKRWLITDFGIARHTEPSADAITSVGAVIGTPAYMAPEQAAGVELDGRTDMFALAATACEALTGKRLRPHASQNTAVRALQASAVPVAPGFAAALTAPLTPDPDDRPATMRDWIAQVTSAGRRPWWRSVTALAAAAAVVMLVGIAWLLLPARSPAPTVRPVIAVLPFEDVTAQQVGRALPAAFEDELRYVPGLEVVPPAAVASALAEAGLGSAGTADSAITAALGQYNVSGVLTGSIEDVGAGEVRLRVYLRSPDGSTTQAPMRTVPTDSLRAAIAGLVLDLFPFVSREVAYRPAIPGGGVAAMNALYTGDSLFRAAAYDGAIAEYDRVLALDSTYALAAFKRMLAEVMRTQPTRASREVRTALDPVRRHRDQLDPQTRELLAAYEVLVTEGDVERAHELMVGLTSRYPLAVDAWFIRGYVEFYFGALFGTAPTRARSALDRTIALDPGYAAARGLRGWIALLENEEDVARRELGAYLAIDSVSTWAALARLADSLRLRSDGVAFAALRTVERRPSAALELFALAGASLRLTHAERNLVGDVARELRDRATTAEERATAFRLQLGNALGSGRAVTVDTLFREAARRDVPRDELDRAAVLLAVTGLHPGIEAVADVAGAAARLAADTATPDGPWLAARWLRARDSGRGGTARRTLERLAAGEDGRAILARGLVGDLIALDRVAAGDTAGALERWAAATRRVQIEEVPFGLVGSLWPLRLTWARVAAARRDPNEVLRATATFEESAGFMDQAARLVALPLRAAALEATLDLLAARDLRRRYADVLRDASGSWAVLRDTLRALSGGR
jgi:tetratricopeptide (TPR) repeat protein